MSATSSLSPEPEERAGRSNLAGFGTDGPPAADVLADANPAAVVELANEASVDALARLVAADGQLVQSRLLRGGQKFIVEVAKAPFDKDDKQRIWAIFKENMSASYRVSSFGWTPKAKQSELFHPESRYILLRHAKTGREGPTKATASAKGQSEVKGETWLEVGKLDLAPTPDADALAGQFSALPQKPVLLPPSPPPGVKDKEEMQVSDLLGLQSSSSPQVSVPTVCPASSDSPGQSDTSDRVDVPNGLVASSSMQVASSPSTPISRRALAASALQQKDKARASAHVDSSTRRRSARFQPSTPDLPSPSTVSAPEVSQQLTMAASSLTPAVKTKASARVATKIHTPPVRTSARRTVTVGVNYRETDARSGRPMGSSVNAAPLTPRVGASISAAPSISTGAPAEDEEPYDPYAKRKKLGRPRKASVERRLAYEAAAEAAELEKRAQRRAERQRLAEAREREAEERKGFAVEGYLMWRFDTEPNEHGVEEPIVYLYELSVAHEFQRAGLGRYLVSRLESLGRAWGCRKVILTVLRSNIKAIAFYRKMGYAIDHSSPSRFTWSDSEDEDSTTGDVVDAPPPYALAALAAEDDDAPTSSPVKKDPIDKAEDEPEISGMLWIGGTWRKVKYDYEIMSKTLFDEDAPVAGEEVARITTTTLAETAINGSALHAQVLGPRSSAVEERRSSGRRRESGSQRPTPIKLAGPSAAPGVPAGLIDGRQSSSATALPWLEASLSLPTAHIVTRSSMPTLAAVHAVAPAAFSSGQTSLLSGENGSKKKRKRLSIVGVLGETSASAVEAAVAGDSRKGPKLHR